MSPKNHLLTRDQISVWYIPSVPGADAGMYSSHFCIQYIGHIYTFMYLLHFGTQCGTLVTIVDYGDF